MWRNRSIVLSSTDVALASRAALRGGARVTLPVPELPRHTFPKLSLLATFKN